MDRKATDPLYLVLLIVAGGWKKPYNPPAVAVNSAFLVVEGIINSGSDSTIIKIGRTTIRHNKGFI